MSYVARTRRACQLLQVAVGAFALCTMAPASAQLRADLADKSVLYPSNLSSYSSYSERTLMPSATPAPSISFSSTSFRQASWLNSSIQMELPRDVVTGQYTRPKFIVGLPSDSMRSWMNATGLTAEKCMLPMLRARTHMSGDGDLSGSLWLYARCTFY